jgi:hypothetical protein
VRRSLALVALGLAACVAPTPSFTAYEGKAAATAATALSSVSAARLAVRLAMQGKAFAPYVSTSMVDAEGDVRSAQGLFDSIQPPDTASDRLRTELDAILTRAIEEITTLRIRARWTDVRALAAASRGLTELADRLDRFLARHE